MIGLVQAAGGAFQWFGDRIVGLVDRRIERGLQRAGAAVVARAQALAPVKTGALRSGIGYRVSGRILTVFASMPYSMYQEFGTRHIRPHPYLRPALNEVGRVLGGAMAMEFAVGRIDRPIIAHQAGFILPPTLTAGQRRHVAAHLGPTSRRLFRGNVRRATMRVRRVG